MATGSSADIQARIAGAPPYGVLPKWWAWVAPVRDALIGGASDLLASCYSFIAYVKTQTRLWTATGVFIDIFGFDFLGLAVVRRTGESDAVYAARVRKEILRERVTRSGMGQALTDLTGQQPNIFEPWNTNDAGAWNTGTLAWSGGGAGGAGAWGSTLMPNQVMIIVYRSSTVGVGLANYGGWSHGTGSSATPSNGGWNTGGVGWSSAAMALGGITDQDIYDCINLTKPVGVVVWVSIQNTPVPLTWVELQALFPGDLYLNGGVVVVSSGFPTSTPSTSMTPYSNGGVLCMSPGAGPSVGTPSWALGLPTTEPSTPGFVYLNGGEFDVS